MMADGHFACGKLQVGRSLATQNLKSWCSRGCLSSRSLLESFLRWLSSHCRYAHISDLSHSIAESGCAVQSKGGETKQDGGWGGWLPTGRPVRLGHRPIGSIPMPTRP